MKNAYRKLIFFVATMIVVNSQADTNTDGPLSAEFAQSLGYRVLDVSRAYQENCGGFMVSCTKVTYSWRGMKPVGPPNLYSRLSISHLTFSSKDDALQYSAKVKDIENEIAQMEPSFRDKSTNLKRTFIINNVLIETRARGTYCLGELNAVSKELERHFSGARAGTVYYPYGK